MSERDEMAFCDLSRSPVTIPDAVRLVPDPNSTQFMGPVSSYFPPFDSGDNLNIACDSQVSMGGSPLSLSSHAVGLGTGAAKTAKTPRKAATRFVPVPRKRQKTDAVTTGNKNKKSAVLQQKSSRSLSPTPQDGSSWQFLPHDTANPDVRLGQYIATTKDFQNPAILNDFIAKTSFGPFQLQDLREQAALHMANGDREKFDASCTAITLGVLYNSLIDSFAKQEKVVQKVKMCIASPTTEEKAKSAIGFGADPCVEEEFELGEDKWCQGVILNDCYEAVSERWKGKLTSEAKFLEFFNAFIERVIVEAYDYENYVLLTFRDNKLDNNHIDFDGKMLVDFVLAVLKNSHREVNEQTEANITELTKLTIQNFRRRAVRAALKAEAARKAEAMRKAEEERRTIPARDVHSPSTGSSTDVVKD